MNLASIIYITRYQLFGMSAPFDIHWRWYQNYFITKTSAWDMVFCKHILLKLTVEKVFGPNFIVKHQSLF